MRKRIRLTDKEIVDTVNSFTVNLEPMSSISKRLGITRQGVYRLLKKAGVDISAAAWIEISCSCCGKTFKQRRCRVRRSKHSFCSDVCYQAWLKHGNGNPLTAHKESSRIARSVVSRFFALTPENIVHHEDENQWNNMPDNLKVFANQGNHVRYHQGSVVSILWDGSQLGIK